MIIKDKLFKRPACPGILCWFHASPVVLGVAIPLVSGCSAGLVRRWPGFPELEAYQVRLSRIAVNRWAYLCFDRGLADFLQFDALVNAGGVW